MKYTAPVDSTVFLLKDVLGFDNELKYMKPHEYVNRYKPI